VIENVLARMIVCSSPKLASLTRISAFRCSLPSCGFIILCSMDLIVIQVRLPSLTPESPLPIFIYPLAHQSACASTRVRMSPLFVTHRGPVIIAGITPVMNSLTSSFPKPAALRTGRWSGVVTIRSHVPADFCCLFIYGKQSPPPAKNPNYSHYHNLPRRSTSPARRPTNSHSPRSHYSEEDPLFASR